MAPAARELSKSVGVVEPLQTATSIAGQVEELRSVLAANAGGPVVLIGHSWGAWLSYIFASENPAMVSKLILVSSGPFEEKYAAGIIRTRMSRLSEEERKEAAMLMMKMGEPDSAGKNAALERFGSLMSKADAYDPLPAPNEVIWCQYDMYGKIWPEAAELRHSGKLLGYGERIGCPVVAIHGDYDPHPYLGVKEPLSRELADFRFILLEKCGHTPWNERAARERFFDILRNEIGVVGR